MDKSRLKIINRDAIKYIIVFFMFCGHLLAWLNVGDTPPDGLFADCPLWQRLLIELSIITPPVMFFFVADGFKYTRSRRSRTICCGFACLVGGRRTSCSHFFSVCLRFARGRADSGSGRGYALSHFAVLRRLRYKRSGPSLRRLSSSDFIFSAKSRRQGRYGTSRSGRYIC